MEETQSTDQPITITNDLAKRIQEEIGQNVYLCYQCVKCTSGCPVAEFFDWQPNQIMRAVQLGQEDIALESETIWLCAACQTCTTRCPQGLDIAAIMEFLARESLKRGIKPKVPAVNAFNQAFLREINIWGRSYEPGIMVEMGLQDPLPLLKDIDLYMAMLKKRKVAFFPDPTRKPSHRKAKPIEAASSAIGYYPGCSLETTATEFNISSKKVCEAIGIELIEPKGWICCGSTPAHKADPQAAIEYPMENLALFEKSGFTEVTMPCASCYNRHKTVQHEIRERPDLKASIDETLKYEYQDSVYVSTLAEAIYKNVGPERVAEKVTNHLEDLHLACYYGCLLTRPPEVTGVANYENPTDMDELMVALGAEVHDWSYKTICCGAAHALSRPDIILKLSGNIIKHAREAGAEAIVVSCPLCHMNLDARQIQMDLDEPMPILYFTQLMALALDLPSKDIGLHKNIIDPRPLLREKSLISD
ncbi:MAG: heterodisulfide reductase-related iron-sulfur binding cluster [Chloroflexota bacterium]|nr:heterodisulfide reductase-related iron-sulfur binding cluster [Chloroflexota bacterium]